VSVVQGKQNVLINSFMSSWEQALTYNLENLLASPENMHFENDFANNLIQV